jgi:hypothetical protein
VRTRSSTKTFPFFFPLGFSTPTGVIILSVGMPNSFSVYTRRFFFFTGPPLDFNGGALLFGGFRCFETPSLCGLVLFLLLRIPDLLAACLDFTVVVRDGAIVEIYGFVDRGKSFVEIYLVGGQAVSLGRII